MKIILLQNVKGLGNVGDVKEVANGYARNFLLPKKIVEIATDAAIEKVKKEKAEKEKTATEEMKKIKDLAKKIEGKEVIIKAKTKDKKLFGSVGTKEIAEKLGGGISEDMIELKENIKETGAQNITVDFGSDIKAKIKIIITGEK